MSETQKNVPKRKFGWVDKWVKMTGERARIDAKAIILILFTKRMENWSKNFQMVI